MYNNAVSPPPPSSHTQTQLHANMIIAPNHRKTQSLDAGPVLCATNSGGGGGNSGSTITEAAIKASATTKSMHCTRERYVYSTSKIIIYLTMYLFASAVSVALCPIHLIVKLSLSCDWATLSMCSASRRMGGIREHMLERTKLVCFQLPLWNRMFSFFVLHIPQLTLLSKFHLIAGRFVLPQKSFLNLFEKELFVLLYRARIQVLDYIVFIRFLIKIS